MASGKYFNRYGQIRLNNGDVYIRKRAMNIMAAVRPFVLRAFKHARKNKNTRM